MCDQVFLRILLSEDENRAEGLGDLGKKTRDEVVSALTWRRRLWYWYQPLLISSETLELGQGMQRRQLLSTQERPKDKLGVMNHCKGIKSSNETNYGTELHPA